MKLADALVAYGVREPTNATFDWNRLVSDFDSGILVPAGDSTFTQYVAAYSSIDRWLEDTLPSAPEMQPLMRLISRIGTADSSFSRSTDFDSLVFGAHIPDLFIRVVDVSTALYRRAPSIRTAVDRSTICQDTERDVLWLRLRFDQPAAVYGHGCDPGFIRHLRRAIAETLGIT